VGRFWSILFLLVPILGVLVFVWAIADWWPVKQHWLPENINDYGGVIDNLFMFILWVTGIIFVGTSIALFWFMWKYDAAVYKGPVQYTHGSHTLEIIWSILPAATLLFIAIFQMSAWADAKMKRPLLDKGADGLEGTADDVVRPPIVEVTGRQFEWRIRYPGKDGIIGTDDDIHTVNDLHLPYGEDVVIQIKSQDVLHSFFLPNMRVKQDVVPGMKQFVWFRIKPPKSSDTKARTYDIVCAELCGWGHYKMRGRVYVESRADFERWLESKWESQNQASFTKVTAEGE
jgi:cytochrome c oxidase subunit 2